jgi:hypothetical protein
MEADMADVRQAGVDPVETQEPSTSENRGYWGYRELTEEEMAQSGFEEAGCGCGCGGK